MTNLRCSPGALEIALLAKPFLDFWGDIAGSGPPVFSPITIPILYCSQTNNLLLLLEVQITTTRSTSKHYVLIANYGTMVLLLARASSKHLQLGNPTSCLLFHLSVHSIPSIMNWFRIHNMQHSCNAAHTFAQFVEQWSIRLSSFRSGIHPSNG